MKNSTILSTLEELLNVMDARAHVNIFNKELSKDERLIRSEKLYCLIADNEFLSQFGSFKVVGLSVALGVTSILIEEA